MTRGAGLESLAAESDVRGHRMTEHYIEVMASGTWTETVTRPAWTWRCGLCGWLGTGLTSEASATREANHHLDAHTDEELRRG